MGNKSLHTDTTEKHNSIYCQCNSAKLHSFQNKRERGKKKLKPKKPTLLRAISELLGRSVRTLDCHLAHSPAGTELRATAL